jgi:hypothetical protein
MTKGIECFVGADFVGGWDQIDSGSPNNVLSRTGFVILYAGCPLYCSSKLQTEIALSTTESKYSDDVIPLMTLLAEIDVILDLHIPKPLIHCKVFTAIDV